MRIHGKSKGNSCMPIWIIKALKKDMEEEEDKAVETPAEVEVEDSITISAIGNKGETRRE